MQRAATKQRQAVDAYNRVALEERPSNKGAELTAVVWTGWGGLQLKPGLGRFGGASAMGYVEIIVPVLSALLGWYLGVRSERIAAVQYKLSASGFAADWFRDLRSWASEAIDVLCESAYAAPGRADSTPIDPQTCTRCRHRLSALIDRGRFFIPNYVPDAVGPHKPSAFRGLRHPALDYLVAAEQLLAGSAPDLSGSFPSARAALVAIKRHFVSQIQEVLDPRTQNKAIAELVKASRGDTSDTRSAFERLAQDELPDFSGDGAILPNKPSVPR